MIFEDFENRTHYDANQIDITVIATDDFENWCQSNLSYTPELFFCYEENIVKLRFATEQEAIVFKLSWDHSH